MSHRRDESGDRAQLELCHALRVVLNRAMDEDDVTTIDIIGALEKTKLDFYYSQDPEDLPEDGDGDEWKAAHSGRA